MQEKTQIASLYHMVLCGSTLHARDVKTKHGATNRGEKEIDWQEYKKTHKNK